MYSHLLREFTDDLQDKKTSKGCSQVSDAGCQTKRHPSLFSKSIAPRQQSSHVRSSTPQPPPPHSQPSSIKVYARFRPLSRVQQELTSNGFGGPSVTYLSQSTAVLEDHSMYTLDRVLPPLINQEDTFSLIAKQTIKDVLNGYNGTIFAYGQTGSGKTYTMVGDVRDEQAKGIIPRAITEIFASIEKQELEVDFTLSCSILEIYKENLFDLLSDHKDLKIKESPARGIYVEGLASVTICTEKELYSILEIGEQCRKTSATKVNENSSRSHTLFMLEVRQSVPRKGQRMGKLNLVDLAGSEKISKTGAVGLTLEEAKKINFSLSCLGNVIHALTNGNDYIPYRDSKLTRILSESLGGNFKTSLIVTCSSHSASLDQTVSTLKFATRAKSIKNNVKMNVKSSPQQMQKMINELRSQLIQAQIQLQIYQGRPPQQLDESHEQAHQTVLTTNRLRMVKNPFQRSISRTSQMSSQAHSCSQVSFSCGGQGENSDLEFLAKRVGELEATVGKLRDQLQLQKDLNGSGWREAVERAVETQKNKYREYSEELETICKTQSKSNSNVSGNNPEFFNMLPQNLKISHQMIRSLLNKLSLMTPNKKYIDQIITECEVLAMKQIIKIQNLTAQSAMATILVQNIKDANRGDRTDRTERKGLQIVSKMDSGEFFKQMIEDYKKSTTFLQQRIAELQAQSKGFTHQNSVSSIMASIKRSHSIKDPKTPTKPIAGEPHSSSRHKDLFSKVELSARLPPPPRKFDQNSSSQKRNPLSSSIQFRYQNL